jgi:tight adherence protein B
MHDISLVYVLWGLSVAMLFFSLAPAEFSLQRHCHDRLRSLRTRLSGLLAARHTRMDEFHKELPQATELLAGAIQAGSSLRQALVQVAAFSSPVVAREFREIIRLTQFGHSMDAAFDRWSSQTRSQPALDMSFCIRLSVQSGGSLSEALKRFAEALRQELLLAEKMKTLTSQGRLQALVMLAIPVLLGLTLLMIDPESARFFLQTWQGLMVIVFVLTLETFGALWIRRLVRVEI